MKSFIVFAIIAIVAVFGSRPLERVLKVPTIVRRLFAGGLAYLLLGALMGPTLLDVISEDVREQLSPVVTIGLFWIGFLFGINLKWRDLKRVHGPVYVLAFGQALLTFAAVAAAFAVLLPSLFPNASTETVIAGIVVLAACASGTAQTSLLRLTRFRGFRGPTAQLATVSATLDDIPGLIAVGLLACFWSPGVREASALAGLGWLGLSVVTGAIGGLVIILFLSRTHNDQTRLLGLMGALSVGGGLTAYLHLSPLFVGAVMGALYVNVSRRDDHVFNIVTRSESTFYVLFLILVGSLLQFRGEDLVLGMAVYLVVRIAAKAISGFLFLAPARNVERPSSLVGLALLSQGGMAIAMAAHYGAAENSVVAQSAVSIVILGVIMNELYGEPLAAWVVGARTPMIRDLAILAALLGLVWFVNGVNLGYEFALGDQGALAFGFILLASFIIGGMTRHLKMPRITGYLIAGLIFGPSILGRLVPVLGILTPEVVRELSIFNSIALGLIAFSAGGELKIEALRPRAGAIARLTVWRIVLLFFGTAALVIACGGLLPWPGGGGIGTTAGMAILFGAAALAKSPASTIALIIEYEAKGPMTTTVLGTTLLGDVVILIMFSVAMIAAKILLVAGATADIAFAGLIVWEVIGSLAIGTALGYLLAQYMTYVGREMPIILVALSFLALELAREMHLSGMLICLAAGFYVENFTGKGDRLIQAIDRYSLPLFVLFFTIAGAGLDLSVLAGMWPVVLFLVLTRLVLTWLSAWLGRRGDPELDLPGRTMWTGFVTQAGVTLGIAELIGREIPGIGPEIKTIIVAGIAVNQIIGPIAFRYGLLRSGEATVSA